MLRFFWWRKFFLTFLNSFSEITKTLRANKEFVDRHRQDKHRVKDLEIKLAGYQSQFSQNMASEGQYRHKQNELLIEIEELKCENSRMKSALQTHLNRTVREFQEFISMPNFDEPIPESENSYASSALTDINSKNTSLFSSVSNKNDLGSTLQNEPLDSEVESGSDDSLDFTLDCKMNIRKSIARVMSLEIRILQR